MEGYLAHKRSGQITVRLPSRLSLRKSILNDAGQDTDIKNIIHGQLAFPDTSDPVTDFSLQILGHILIDTPASPLKKALLDSGLGEDLTGLGLENELRQHIFSTGLKGTRASDAKKIEKLIFNTLETLVHDGIDPDMTAPSTPLSSICAKTLGSFPRGISVILRPRRLVARR
jgi:Zn-dependent M16 (insulinase) family peptidase